MWATIPTWLHLMWNIRCLPHRSWTDVVTYHARPSRYMVNLPRRSWTDVVDYLLSNSVDCVNLIECQSKTDEAGSLHKFGSAKFSQPNLTKWLKYVAKSCKHNGYNLNQYSTSVQGRHGNAIPGGIKLSF